VKYVFSILFLLLHLFSKGQKIEKDLSRIEIIIIRDSIVDTTSNINLIQFIGTDTTLSLYPIEFRIVKKVSISRYFEHDLKIFMDNDTLLFDNSSLRKTFWIIEENTPVSSWTIRIFKNMDYAKRFYKEIDIEPNYKKVYSFWCDWCSYEELEWE
jgi:hypothetical protein